MAGLPQIAVIVASVVVALIMFGKARGHRGATGVPSSLTLVTVVMVQFLPLGVPCGHEWVVDDVAAIGEGVEHIGAATAIGTTTVVANTALAISRSRRRNGPIATPGLNIQFSVRLQAA
jgi:hypothetical protein